VDRAEPSAFHVSTARVVSAGLLPRARTTLGRNTMRLLLVSVSLAFLAACSSGKQIKDQPDAPISKKPAMWTDPGAVLDKPRDAGSVERDARVPDAATPDAGPSDAGASDARTRDAG